MIQPRIPSSCPAGFQGRYTVVSGDTMFLIAQRFGVSLDSLIAANPHITNPNMIFPGTVLVAGEASRTWGQQPRGRSPRLLSPWLLQIRCQGTQSTSPGKITFGSVICGFAAIRESKLTPNIWAMENIVSPACTV
jgi:LysM repeat protein